MSTCPILLFLVCINAVRVGKNKMSNLSSQNNDSNRTSSSLWIEDTPINTPCKMSGRKIYCKAAED